MENIINEANFGDLPISGLEEDFLTESLAISYLNEKFGEEVSEEIKKRITKTLSTNGKDYDT